MLGIAREAAATFDKKFVPPVIKETGNDEKASDYVKVTVEDPELCPRYTARVVKNVKIGPSPKWMQRCLASNGIRPINNLVDITNYVMEEYGQPMHAYDLDTIEGREIVVRRAKAGEKFVTLDGQEREMDDQVLYFLKQHASTERTFVFLPRESDFVQMHPVNLKKGLIRIMQKQQLTVHAS